MIFKDTRVNSLSELINVIKQGTHRVTLKNHEATVSKGFMAEAINASLSSFKWASWAFASWATFMDWSM